MAANRKRPTVWKWADLDLDPALLTPQLEVVELAFPPRMQQCEIIEASDEAEAGRQLAYKLRDAGLL